jgi:hypothetical protein
MKKPFNSRAFSALPGYARVPRGMEMIDPHFGDVGAGTTWRGFGTEGTGLVHLVASATSNWTLTRVIAVASALINPQRRGPCGPPPQ